MSELVLGIDSRSTREIAELTERYGADAILARSGTLLSSQAVGPKLAWLRRHEPDVWGWTRQLLMPNTFIAERLTGEYVLDHHSASQCDPLYEVQANRWADDWAAERAGLYDALYATYRALYPATREAMHTLADLQLRSERPHA